MGHLHLMINHIPVVGLLFGVALLAVGMKKNSTDLNLAALCTFLFISVVALAVFFTGDPAEDVLKKVAGINEKELEKFIAPHEEAGLVFLITMIVAGIISAFGIFKFSKTKVLNPTLLKALLAVSIIALLLAGRTAQLGGQIRHSEVRAASISGLAEASEDNLGEQDNYENGMPEPANSSK
jgi:hypothetical protein